MSTNPGDQSILAELDYIRSERKRLKIYKANLLGSIPHLESRMAASQSAKVIREMKKRIENRRSEIYAISVDLGFLDRSWDKMVVRAKLRGLVDDRLIATWQGEDHV